MAGKLLPERVAGELEETCLKILAQKESELFLAPWDGSAPLTQSEWQTVTNDFHKGKAATMAYLQLKTSYLQRLPWLLCALAHTSEDVAREFAGKIVTSWQQYYQKEGHHG